MPEIKFSVEFQELNSAFESEFQELNSTFESEFGTVQEVVVGGTTDHRELMHRDAPDQHPINAITNLEAELDVKLETVPALSNQDIENILKGFV